ncbi:ferrous iron transport protein B [Capnocytophaga cynodegmi]|uniref:Ferrous iron transport protein B n=1 Tax=Capnocytophaga cynodegmi TaxID=28189 RepID=A0A0B7HI65_9FLAO|nr:ferrous iron transport protein B [Capnocytophaga cynodegmi]CEN37203.1 Ferrous iron transport protein B [Capnocytophaga cynodegmi]
MTKREIKVALIGNPNTGKTSIFNALTGLNQKVGNYPGITVEKKIGHCKLTDNVKAEVIDLPGTYSLNANSMDERVAVDILLNKNETLHPDVVAVIADIENLKQNLLIFTQIKDLNIPTILVVNMADQMKRKGISIDVPALERELKTRVILTSTRTRNGLDELKSVLANCADLPTYSFLDINRLDAPYFHNLTTLFPKENAYKLWLIISHNTDFIESHKEIDLAGLRNTKSESQIKQMKQRETILRYQQINEILKKTYSIDLSQAKTLRAKLDKVLIHKVFGYIIFALVLLLVFQAVYDWSSYPMDWIEENLEKFTKWTSKKLPEGALTELLTEGILPGITGILIFIPQIAILFFFISLLEESGYMSRVVFLMDNIMKRFGLNGKSVVPLISGAACAIPAVMIARNIESWKERLITILVTPFMTCSARLPVYLIIIALVIPDGEFLFISYKALTLFALYVLGFVAALLSAFVLDKLLKIKKGKSFFIAEMPNYKVPLWRNVAITVYDKTKSFVLGAGKIILAISIILWFLASHGMGEKYNNIENEATTLAQQQQWDETQTAHFIESSQLEYSYLGYIGKAIEPIFKPLGYDWKISIGVLSSFAAREVFISTLASIYSLGGDLDTEEEEGERTILEKLRSETRTDGTPVYTFATGISLLLFYAFAMQCLSTMAVVRRETNSWKWTALQWCFMTGVAYLSAMLAYQFL